MYTQLLQDQIKNHADIFQIILSADQYLFLNHLVLTDIPYAELLPNACIRQVTMLVTKFGGTSRDDLEGISNNKVYSTVTLEEIKLINAVFAAIVKLTDNVEKFPMRLFMWANSFTPDSEIMVMMSVFRTIEDLSKQPDQKNYLMVQRCLNFAKVGMK